MTATGLIDTTEMYLRTIFELEEEGIVPLRARIAERLSQSGPTVSQTVARMERDGLLHVEGDRHLELTDSGRSLATRVMRKHRLAECLLVNVIGMPWEDVHIEACRWEHVISAEVEELIRAKLDNPLTCPHGNPIPGAGAPEIDVVLLSETQAGDAIRLERVSEELEIDHDALVYLDDHGFVPGVLGKVSTVAPDQTRVVTIAGDQTIAVGSAIANSLYVSLQPA